MYERGYLAFLFIKYIQKVFEKKTEQYELRNLEFDIFENKFQSGVPFSGNDAAK